MGDEEGEEDDDLKIGKSEYLSFGLDGRRVGEVALCSLDV